MSHVPSRSRPAPVSALGGAAAALLLLASCAGVSGEDDALAQPLSSGAEAAESGGGVTVALDADHGLNGDGAELAGDLAGTAPRYNLAASVDPDSGELEGSLAADLPAGGGGEVLLRFFPALIDTEAQVTEVTVDGQAVDAGLDGSLLTVPLGAGHGDRVTVTATFDYAIPEIPESDPLADLGASLGEGLQPSDIGLLGRTDGLVTMGHWFPVWIPDGGAAEPEPQGFGDIGNFPAAVIQAEVDVPAGWTLVSGGVRAGDPGDSGGDGAGGEPVVEGATGLRDLGMVLIEDAETREVEADGTTVRVAAAPGTDAAAMDEVAEEAVTSVETLSEAFGPYPWTEIDVVATPLGSGVGGMEWPGMIWIERSIFAGQLPGLGDLGELGDLGGLGDILGDLGGLGGLGDALDPEMLASVRPWTIAHEVGHEWWHAVVGNDSMLAPVVDEPLAQYSACVVYRRAWPDRAEDVCAFQTSTTYEQMRMMGEEDAPAAQPSDEFTSSLQYGGVVYGKAPGVYDALGEELGDDAVVDALAGVVSEHAFEQISVDQLHATLAEHLGDPEAIDRLWSRWIEGTHGDEDLGVDPSQAGALGGLGGLGGLGDLGELGELGELGDLGSLTEEDLAAILEQLGLGG